jgi:hypothetical protein
VITLPDGPPESLVFGYIKQNIGEVCSLIKQRCQCPAITQDKIVEKIEYINRDTEDHHLYFSKFGDELGFISEIVVRRGLCSIYVEKNKLLLLPIVDAVRQKFNL